jgi:hypothetical protein
VKYSDFEKLGIQETDKGDSYLTLKDISKIKEHMDKILEKLGSEEHMRQKMALKEIACYEQTYVLTPVQLNLVITQFNKGIDRGNIDDELADKLVSRQSSIV